MCQSKFLPHLIYSFRVVTQSLKYCHYFWFYEKILILPDCVEHETDFAGNDINAHRNDTDYARGAGRRNSIGQCRDLCQSRDGCNYFTYNKRFRHCYLKTSDSGRRSFTRYSGVSSGTKFCGKMNCKDFCNDRIFILVLGKGHTFSSYLKLHRRSNNNANGSHIDY